MVEDANAGNTGGCIAPDDAVTIFAPHFAADGFHPIGLPASNHLVRFIVPFAPGEPPVEIKASDIIGLYSKMRGPTFASDSDDPIIVEAK